MNDEPLPRDHGFPIRAVVPRHTGSCQCKRLHKVIVSNEESGKLWQRKSYSGFPPEISFEEQLSNWLPPRLDQAPVVHSSMPVQSFACNPRQNSWAGMKGGTNVEVKGVACSEGGKIIERVDTSIDSGKTSWTAVELYKAIEQQHNFTGRGVSSANMVSLPEDACKSLANGEQASIDIVPEATKSDFDVQPERMEPYWNVRGVVSIIGAMSVPHSVRIARTQQFLA